MKKYAWIIGLGVIAIIIPYILLFVMKSWYDNKLENFNKSSFIIINKEDYTLKVFDTNGDSILTFAVGLGKNLGNKVESGDMRTPEGIFRVSQIQDASGWKHDFGDGKGEIKGAYGPFFFRLDTPPHKGIGIHGTHLPSSIGTRCTEGCIRLRNEDLIVLKDYIYHGLPVIILPSQQDIITNTKITTKK